MRKIIAITTLYLVSLSSTAWAVDCPLTDTGQTKCYDVYGDEITFPQPGEPFYGQDAQYSCNPQSYTMLSGGIMVRDNVTGLIWEVKQDKDDIQNYANPNDADNTYVWCAVEAETTCDGIDTKDFINELNSANFGGYNDWRMPTVKELSFIRNMDTYNPAIDTDYFPNTVLSYYWSSIAHATSPNGAWRVYFGYGSVDYWGKSGSHYVRAVRGGQCGSLGNFVDNGDGTVTDTSTGLMWQQDTTWVKTWQEALSYCENLTLAWYNDWRLPSVNELQSLVDYSTTRPAIDTDYFPNTVSVRYWSSTSYVGNPNSAWYIWFDYGGVYSAYGKNSYARVRAVRGGQCESLDDSTTTTVESITTTTLDGSTTTTTDGDTTTTAVSTTTTTIQPCPTEIIYGEHSEQTELLRYIRDNVLSQTPAGQELIRLYYEWSPVIVQVMEEDEEFKQDVKEMFDGDFELIGEKAE